MPDPFILLAAAWRMQYGVTVVFRRGHSRAPAAHMAPEYAFAFAICARLAPACTFATRARTTGDSLFTDQDRRGHGWSAFSVTFAPLIVAISILPTIASCTPFSNSLGRQRVTALVSAANRYFGILAISRSRQSSGNPRRSRRLLWRGRRCLTGAPGSTRNRSSHAVIFPMSFTVFCQATRYGERPNDCAALIERCIVSCSAGSLSPASRWKECRSAARRLNQVLALWVSLPKPSIARCQHLCQPGTLSALSWLHSRPQVRYATGRFHTSIKVHVENIYKILLTSMLFFY